MTTFDQEPISQDPDAVRLFQSDLKHFSMMPDSELEGLLNLAEIALGQEDRLWPHPDTLRALVEVSQIKGLAVSPAISLHVVASDRPSLSDPPVAR